MNEKLSKKRRIGGRCAGRSVYAAGYYSDGSKTIPCYWTDSTRTDLPADSAHSSKATSIAVAP
jgi:hypothetical protein